MAKKSGLVSIGWILSLFGAILMIIFAIIAIINEFTEISGISGMTVNFFPDDPNIQNAGIIVAIVVGLIIIWIWTEKKLNKRSDLPLLGILFIIFGIITGLSLAGLLVILGGILFLIEYYF